MSEVVEHAVGTDKAPVMALKPDADLVGRSPLAHVALAELAQHNPAEAGVHFGELPLQAHFTLRCAADNPAQQSAVESVVGVPLPVEPLRAVTAGDAIIRWMSPDEWLISVPEARAFALEEGFRTHMPGHYALVNVSGGLTVYRLSGPHAIDVLKRSVPVDLHHSQFPVGKVVSTVFAKAGATLRRVDDQTFELVVRRSFADYIWLWIQDASREFGLSIDV